MLSEIIRSEKTISVFRRRLMVVESKEKSVFLKLNRFFVARSAVLPSDSQGLLRRGSREKI